VDGRLEEFGGYHQGSRRTLGITYTVEVVREFIWRASFSTAADRRGAPINFKVTASVESVQNDCKRTSAHSQKPGLYSQEVKSLTINSRIWWGELLETTRSSEVTVFAFS